jgi:hypothetical protein
MHQAQPEHLGYEEALRVIGRHLDMEPAYNMVVEETPEGFLLRYQPTSSPSEARVVQYTSDRLRDLVIFHSSGRGSPRKRGRYHGLWARFPNGHQGFLRALGYRLDREQANSILIQEKDDGVYLSYLPTDVADRSEVFYSESDIREILEDAEHRRRSDADLVRS